MKRKAGFIFVDLVERMNDQDCTLEANTETYKNMLKVGRYNMHDLYGRKEWSRGYR